MHTAFRLLIVLPLAFVLLTSAAEAQPAPTGDSARLDFGVHEALQSNGSVAVVVSLAAPAVAARGPVDVDQRRRETAAVQAEVLARAPGLALARRYRVVPALAGRIDADGLAQLEADPNVAAVSLDRPVQATLGESVPLVRAHLAHNAGITGAGTAVAVLDTGIDTDHPDLTADLLSEACFLVAAPGCHNGESSDSGPGSAEDDHGHGSHVSGIVTSGGVISSRGVAPDAGVRAYKILNAAGSGVTSDIIAALDDVIANYPDTDAINMSLSDGVTHAAGTCDDDIQALTTAIATLRAGGTVVVASSGNDATKTGTGYPACISTVVSTGAVYDADVGGLTFSSCTDTSSAADEVPCFSNSDASLRMLAPGCATRSSTPGDTTANLCGTSMAAPHIAAAVALLRHFDGSLTPDAIESCLETTGAPITDPANGVTTPRLDVASALGCAGFAVGGMAGLPEIAPFSSSDDGPPVLPIALAGVAAAALVAAGWLMRARLRRT